MSLIAGVCLVVSSSASAQQTKDLSKKEDLEKVQTVEVLAIKQAKKATEKSSFSGEDLLHMPGSGGDPIRGAQNLPGIATPDDFSGGAAVRGARPSDNAYYVDALPVGYLFHMGGFVSVFNPELIRQFDLHSAAWSPHYGDVIGGVFDVSLRNPRTDKIGGKINAGIFTSGVLVEGPLSENTSFFISARRSIIDLLVKDEKEETTKTKESDTSNFTFPSFSDVQARFLWNFHDQHRLRLDLSTAQDSVKFTLGRSDVEAQREPVLLGKSFLSNSYHNVAAVLESDFGSAKKSDSHNRLTLGRMVAHDNMRIGSAGTLVTSSTLNYFRQQFTANIGTDHHVMAGVDVDSEVIALDINMKNPRCTEFEPGCDATSADFAKSKHTRRENTLAAYLHDRWALSPQWALSAGLRSTRNDYLKQNAVDPRIGLEYSYTPQTSFSIRLGRHHQAPAKDQTFIDIGNPHLKSLRSTQIVVGAAQNLDDGWSWKAELYRKNFDQFVISDDVLNYRNGARGTAHGLELLVKKTIGYGLTGFASLSLSKSQRENEKTGERFSFGFDQPVIANVVLQYKPSDKFQYGARWSYHTGQPDTPIIGTRKDPDGRVRPIYGALNSNRLPAYHRLDLRMDYRYSENLSFYTELMNAYARKNVGGYSYSADYKTRSTDTQMPTFPWVGLEYKF